MKNREGNEVFQDHRAAIYLVTELRTNIFGFCISDLGAMQVY